MGESVFNSEFCVLQTIPTQPVVATAMQFTAAHAVRQLRELVLEGWRAAAQLVVPQPGSALPLGARRVALQA